MVFDLHNDLLTSGLNDGGKHTYVQANSENIITLAYWTSREKNPLPQLNAFIRRFKMYENVRFAVEDIGFLTDAEIPAFLKLPLLYCTLVWKDENSIAGGHNTENGLTQRGKRIVEMLAQAGIKIDAAHLSEKGFYDVLKITPDVINSHCCLKSINPHTRNITDEQIREIINCKGLIGLAAVDDFFGREKGIDGYIRQIDMFVQKFGCKSLSVGTDFHGANSVKGIATYNDFNGLTYRLQNLGYKSEDIESIYFQNAASYFNVENRKIRRQNTGET